MTEENTDKNPIESTDQAAPAAEGAPTDQAALTDEAALNEEASRELEALLAEEESAVAMDAETPSDDEIISAPQSDADRSAIIEALIFVSDEPLSTKILADVLKLDKAVVE